MKLNHTISNLIIALFFGTSFFQLQAQNLISSAYLSSVSEANLEAEYFFDFSSGVDLYRVLYTTPDVLGVLDTASGLLVVPDDPGFAYPLLVFQHGTVNDRWDVPSQLAGGYQLATVFGGQGYATVAPDYVGLGEARGLHPYVHADTEASAAVDFLYAAKQFADQNNFLQLNDQVFVTGYSQGGHAALAAHRALELDYSADFTVTASAPMSGPYSISKKMIDFTLGDTPYGFVAYIAWTALSYNLAYGNLFSNVDEFFKPNYATFVEQFRDEVITLGQLNAELTAELINDVGAVTPKAMLQPAILDAILNDPSHPVSVALADNDLHNWEPQAPTHLVYCTADDQVFYQNAVFADSIMNANGAPDVSAHDVNPTADHGGCVQPAMIHTILFFNGLKEVTVATRELTGSPDDPFLVAPNPVRDELLIQKLTEIGTSSNVALYDVHGKLVRQSNWSNSDLLRLDVKDLNEGLYFLLIDADDGGRYSVKVLVGER